MAESGGYEDARPHGGVPGLLSSCSVVSVKNLEAVVYPWRQTWVSVAHMEYLD